MARSKQNHNDLFKPLEVYQYLKMYFLISILMLLYSCDGSVEINKPLSKDFSTTDKKYFIETALGKGHRVIKKWNRTVITYSIHGAFNKIDIAFIKTTISNLPKSKTIPKFKFIRKDGDVIFYMPKSIKEFKSEQTIGVEVRGFVQANSTLGGYLNRAKIYIAPFRSELYTQITIQHELMHALGLNGHPSSDFRETTALGQRYLTMASSMDTISSTLPRLDSAALLILYDPAVPTLKRIKYISELVGVNK